MISPSGLKLGTMIAIVFSRIRLVSSSVRDTPGGNKRRISHGVIPVFVTLNIGRNLYETLAISWPTVVDAALNRVEKTTCDERLARWSKRVVANANIELDVRGLENFDPAARFVIMSNHQSFYDVPVLFAVLGGNLRMVAKKELFAVPIFSRAMREAGGGSASFLS